MKIKVNEATGIVLDWMVAKCEQATVEVGKLKQIVFDTHEDDPPAGVNEYNDYRWQVYAPSSDWSQGGPIIEKANITIIRANDEYEVDAKGLSTSKPIPCWFAECSRWTGHSLTTSYEGESMEPTFMIGELDGCYGPTPLIAAMRCFVASRLGEEVDVPKELM